VYKLKETVIFICINLWYKMIWSNSDRYYNNNYFQKDVSLHQKQQQNIKNI